MNLTDYQRAAARTSRTEPLTLDVDQARLLNGVLGLIGEWGEYLNSSTIDEAGDVLHGKEATPSTLRRTVSNVMARLDRDWSLEDVAAANIAKLRARYPDGFVEGGGVR